MNPTCIFQLCLDHTAILSFFLLAVSSDVVALCFLVSGIEYSGEREVMMRGLGVGAGHVSSHCTVYFSSLMACLEVVLLDQARFPHWAALLTLYPCGHVAG